MKNKSNDGHVVNSMSTNSSVTSLAIAESATLFHLTEIEEITWITQLNSLLELNTLVKIQVQRVISNCKVIPINTNFFLSFQVKQQNSVIKP